MSPTLDARRARIEGLARDTDLARALLAVSQGEAQQRLQSAGFRERGEAAIACADGTLVGETRGAELMVSGRMRFVVDPERAGWIVARCRTGNEVRWVAIARDATGLSLEPVETPSFPEVPIAHVTATQCHVAPADLLGPDDYRPRSERRLMGASAAISALEAAAEETLSFLGGRPIHGKVLLDLPVVRDRLAGIFAELAILHAHLDAVARTFAGPDRDASRSVAALALLVCARAPDVAASCAQLLGGRGYLTENRVGRLFRETAAVGLLVALPPASRALAAATIAEVQA